MFAEVSEPEPTEIVSQADNRSRLDEIDTGLALSIAAAIDVDRNQSRASSRIICAAVQMLVIMQEDSAAWDAFKARHGMERVACKGKGWDRREVLTVVWRAHKAEKQSNRERISLYGQALEIAAGFYKQGTTEPDALLERIENGGGLRGLIRLRKRMRATGALPAEKKVPTTESDRTDKDESEPARPPRTVTLDVPDQPTLVVLDPELPPYVVDAETARSILIQMGRLQ